MKSLHKRLVVAIIFILLVIGARSLGLGAYLNLEELKRNREFLLLYVEQHYYSAVLLYIFSYIAITSLLLPFAALFTVAGGYLFGTVPGALYTNIGATIGGTIAFLAVRYFFGSYVQERYARQLQTFNRELEQGEVSYLLAIHFIAVIPFSVVNMILGMTKVSLWRFIWTTSLGILPGSLVFSFAGRQLATITKFSDIFTWKVFLAFALLAVLAMVPIFMKRYNHRKG